MRKAHPCGADAWTVTRVGGDVGLRCAGCGRRIFLARRELARRLHPRAQRRRCELGLARRRVDRPGAENPSEDARPAELGQSLLHVGVVGLAGQFEEEEIVARLGAGWS